MFFSISNKTLKPTPRIPFEKIKDKVLGKKYELSLVFCGDSLARRLNNSYRNKNKPTNILSFPISETSGEIFINPSRSEPFGVGKLFIHGLLHLKGMAHGATMEQAEKKLSKQFQFLSTSHDATNRSRNRYRNISNQGSHRRGTFRGGKKNP